MRICYVIHVFPPESWGGSETYVYKLAQQLGSRHDIRVFTRTHRSDQPEYTLLQDRVNGLEVFRLNNNFRDVDRFERIYWNPKVDEVFKKFLDDWRPDVIHAHHLTCLSTNLVNIAHQRAIPFILTIHDFWMMCLRGQRLHPTLRLCEEVIPEVCGQCVEPWMKGAHGRAVADHLGGEAVQLGYLQRVWKKFYEWRTRPDPTREIQTFLRHSQKILESIDLLIVPSAFVRDQFLRFGCDPGKTLFLDNGVDPGFLRLVDRKPSHKLRFGFIGTIIPSKGVHLLVEAFKRLPAEEAELKIFGAAAAYEGFPDYFEKLRRQAAGAPIEFKGSFPNEDVGKVLSEIDVLVVPSIWYENAPLTIREALLAHVPVITANRGGMAESVQDGVNGLHFELGDAESLARALRRLIEDPALLEKLRQAGTPVKTISDNSQELEQIYEKLCRAR
ncbi:MAG: glycosyltransferase family 4 protein [Terriglobia bacterium]